MATLGAIMVEAVNTTFADREFLKWAETRKKYGKYQQNISKMWAFFAGHHV